MLLIFQSTLPVRGATLRRSRSRPSASYFNPRSPCGERRVGVARLAHGLIISIHAPRAGSDRRPCGRARRSRYFNPRSPCGERRRASGRCCSRPGYFNPRSPCGERRKTRTSFPSFKRDFNPRSPCGERLPVRGDPLNPKVISIHAPRAGSDYSSLFIICQ